MKRKMYYFFRKIYYHFLSGLNFVLPKAKNKIFFEDLNCIRDNHYILYTYMLKNNFSGQKIIYYTKKNNEVLRNENVRVIHSTFLATYHYLTARVIFFSYGANRFQCRVTPSQYVINLWHGMPTKQFGYYLNEKAAYPQEKCFTHLVISSSFYEEAFKKACRCSEKQFFVSGAPRLDLLYKRVPKEKIVEMVGGEFDKHIIFMPTFRNSDSLGVHSHMCEFPILNESNVDSINAMLKQNNLCLIVKLHHAQAEVGVTKKALSNIKFVFNTDLERLGIPLYSLLGCTDALISDYSSVYVDYLLVNKPIGFVLEDLEEYKKVRGFVHEPIEEYLPGKHIYDELGFREFIQSVICQEDEFLEQRTKMRDLCNVFQDDKNCERILKFTEIIK